MKKVLLIILLHLSLFFIIFAYHAQAEEDEMWTIDKYESLTYARVYGCLLYTSPSPRDKRQSRMPSSA